MNHLHAPHAAINYLIAGVLILSVILIVVAYHLTFRGK